MNITLSEFEAAEKRIEKIKHRTPLELSNTFSDMTGGEIYLKCENAQKTGSFKIRGAGNKIAKMLESGDRSPVVAPSAGNHAQGISYCAGRFGIESTIVMPVGAPIAKVQATKSYGANVVLSGSGYDEAYKKATEICRETGAKLIHPYDDIDVITGQGTLGAEIVRELPDADIIIVPAGGGGLLAGVSCAVKQINPKIKVIGVQAEGASAIAQSFKAGKKVCTETSATIADGIAVKNPGDLTFELISRYVDGIVTVSDDEIADAVLLLLERAKKVVEGAGATTVAAVLGGKIDVKGKKAVCLLSGGNIDVNTVGNIIERALSARSRRMELYTVIKDGAENIMRFFDDMLETGAVILSFTRDKSSNLLKPDESRLYILCETAGAEHCDRVVAMLRGKGYEIVTASELNEYYKKIKAE